MKTVKAPEFKYVNPQFNSIDKLKDGQEDVLFTFEESNFIGNVDDGILKSSVTEEQFKELFVHKFPLHRLFVEVHVRPNLKDGNHFLMMAGFNHIEEAFKGRFIFPKQKEIYIEYPERWLNLIELRLLLKFLHITYPNSLFYIKTHSVYLIQCTNNECIGIVDNNLSYIQEGVSYENFINMSFETCAPAPDESGIFANGVKL